MPRHRKVREQGCYPSGQVPISPTSQFSWQEDTHTAFLLLVTGNQQRTPSGGKACTSAFPEQVEVGEGDGTAGRGGGRLQGPGTNSASCAVCLEEGQETADKEVRTRGVWKVEVQREDTLEVGRFSAVLSKGRGTDWQVDLGSSLSSALNRLSE